MCFSFRCKIFVFTHAHYQYSISGSLAMFITLFTTAEVFEFSHKTYSFFSDCCHRNYVDSSMLITWMSGRKAHMERNH